MAKYKRTCDVNSEDMEFLKQFEDSLRLLTGMVEEAVVTTPQLLLSPIMRGLLRDKAREVEAMHRKLTCRLCVDNPGDPLGRV